MLKILKEMATNIIYLFKEIQLNKIQVVFLAIIMFIIGWNIGGQGNTLDYIWDKSRSGLRNVNALMKKDDSKRIAILIMTEKSIYQVSSLPTEFKIKGGIFKDGICIYGNLDK